MISAIAVTLLAVVIPTDKLDSVAVAEYWFKKDSRGKGDGISELAMPKRYPAFAVAEDEFIVADPFVRERHLDHIEMTFNGERAPAREIARCMEPEVVIIKSEKPFKGVRPLVFRRGDPFERMTWRWSGDNLTVCASAVGTNDMTSVVVSSGRAFRQGEANSLYVDRNRNPVWLDMGFRHEVQGARFVYPSPLEWTRLDAHVFENAAVGMEKLLSNASVGVLIRLDSESKEDSGRGNGFIIRCGDSQLERNQVDAVGYAIEDRIIVPTLLDGEKIARISRTEATFPDGSVTNLVFAGALAEWNALVFDLPEQFKSKVTPLSIAKDQPESFDNRVAWCATVENENGRVVATVLRQRFRGVDFIRGAAFVPHADGARTSWRSPVAVDGP